MTRPLDGLNTSRARFSHAQEHSRPAAMSAYCYRLNLRVFWPLVACGCTALLCLLHALRRAWDGSGGGSTALLKGSLLLLLALAYLAQRRRRRRRSDLAVGQQQAQKPRLQQQQQRGQRRRRLLELFYAEQLRLSPHVLGHSKAHVSLVVGELVRAGKAQGRLALRGDFVQVGSAYEQHKVRSPDAFDVLLPLRLPPRLELHVAPQRQERAAFVCALEVVPPPDGSRPLNEPVGGGELQALLDGGGRYLSAALLLRWFQGHVQRCLGAVRARLQERCRVTVTVGPGRPLTLHITPRSDYMCCHLSLAVRLIPAIPLGDSLFLTPLQAIEQQPPWMAAASLSKLGGPFWTLNVSRQEQRLLSWVKDQGPADACHLKCLQILKGLRDLGSRSLDQPLSAQWSRILSSYVLKTALFSLLPQAPLQAWEDQFLVERLEDLVLFLKEGLQNRMLRHFFLGRPSLPDAVNLPKVLKEAAPVNLLADFDGPTLDRVAKQLLYTWKQAPKIIRLYSGHKYRRSHPV